MEAVADLDNFVNSFSAFMRENNDLAIFSHYKVWLLFISIYANGSEQSTSEEERFIRVVFVSLVTRTNSLIKVCESFPIFSVDLTKQSLKFGSLWHSISSSAVCKAMIRQFQCFVPRSESFRKQLEGLSHCEHMLFIDSFYDERKTRAGKVFPLSVFVQRHEFIKINR